MASLPWAEKVPVISINPLVASPNEVARLAADYMALRHWAQNAQAYLRALEFSHWDADWECDRCPECKSRQTRGHDSDCALSKILTTFEEGTK